MRKGRFAGLGDAHRDHGAPVSLAGIVSFDFRAADGPHDEQVAEERARTLAHSAPFLALAHLAAVAGLMLALAGGGAAPHPLFFYPAFAGVLLLDLRLWLLSARAHKARKPHNIIALTGLYTILAGFLWMVLTESVIAAGAIEVPGVRVALIAGMAAAIIAFMAIPGLVVLSCLMALGTAAWFGMSPPMLLIAAAFSLLCTGLSLLRARDALLWAARRVEMDWQAQQASRFVADIEESGRGWFWETNADGVLVYVSASLAAQFGQAPEALTGRAFAQLLLVESPAGGNKPALGFHLDRRFPFADLIVEPNGRQDVCWSLSGSPSFDEQGRFLGFRGMAVNLSEQRRAEVETSRLARLDPLTGLANRAEMRAMLDIALRNAASRHEGCSLILIDLDRFKAVNDTLGHPVGDALLKGVAQRLNAVLAEHGRVGRLGGDEFEAVLPGVDEEGLLAALAERLIEQVTRPYQIKGHRISVGASVGIAIARPGRTHPDALIREAHLALYAAKAAGRGTYRFFEPELDSQATARKILEQDLAAAVGNGQLRLLFQPIVDTVSEGLVGFEALVRWAHPTRGLLAPGEFLPLAQDAGLIGGIGDWVVRTACAEAARWPEHLKLAVNLSARECDAALAGRIANALAASGIDPHRLELEIGEEALRGDGAEASALFSALKHLGVRLALDDFGTGYSSIDSLRAASLDRIKLHQNFIRGTGGSNPRGRAVATAVVGLAGSLGMEVTAEGAETLEDLATIRQLGCGAVQGFLFGRPVTADEALTLAGASKPIDAREAKPGRPPRHRLIRRGRLSTGAEPLDVRLRNISSGGAMVECDRSLAQGEPVTLDLGDDMLISGRIRWSQDGRLGLSFDEQFDLKQLGSIKAASGAKMLKPSYLETESSAASPWAGRKERLTLKEVKRA